jgi:hypothetical protein
VTTPGRSGSRDASAARVEGDGRGHELRSKVCSKEINMTVNEALRAMAGIVTLLSLALGYWVSPYWYLLTAFVGLNLLQSAFTKWCPAMAIFRKLGLKEG